MDVANAMKFVWFQGIDQFCWIAEFYGVSILGLFTTSENETCPFIFPVESPIRSIRKNVLVILFWSCSFNCHLNACLFQGCTPKVAANLMIYETNHINIKSQ